MTGDRGAAAVLVLALAGLLSLLGAATSAVAAVGVARQRAAAVADLAALAAAAHVLEGAPVACGRAHRLAAQDAASLRSCRVQGDVVEVVSEVRPPGPLGRLGAATGRARAGPAGSRAGERADRAGRLCGVVQHLPRCGPRA